MIVSAALQYLQKSRGCTGGRAAHLATDACRLTDGLPHFWSLTELERAFRGRRLVLDWLHELAVVIVLLSVFVRQLDVVSRLR